MENDVVKEIQSKLDAKFGEVETLKKAMAEKDKQMEKVAETIANIQKQKSLLTIDADDRERGKTYGLFNAKKDIAMGRVSKDCAYWSPETSKQFLDFLGMTKTKDFVGIKKAFGDSVEDATSEGWTPHQFVPELVRLIFAQSVMLPRVTIVPMNKAQANLPFPKPENMANYMQEWFTVGYIARGGAMLDSKFVADRMTMNAQKAYALAIVDNEDLKDPAMNFGAYLAGQLAADFAIFIDKAILTSNHTNIPVSIYNHPTDDGIQTAVASFNGGIQQTIGEVDATGSLENVITYNNLRSMFKGINELTAQNAEWIMSPAAKEIIRTLTANIPVYNGTSTPVSAASTIPLIPLTADYDFKLWGFPVISTSRLPTYDTASNAGKLAAVLGNFKYSYYGDRIGIAIDTSEHYLFANDQTVFRGTIRHGLGNLPIAFNTLKFGNLS